jgi:VWFA-related protein
MKAIVTLLALILMCGVLSFTAQSRRENPQESGKANKRTVESIPTPTPGNEQVRDASRDEDEVIKVNTQLVSVPVRVMDKKGRFIGGLRKENFTVTEDGVEQEIDLFSNEHQPFTVALVLDMSYSTTFKIAEIQNAAIAFIDQLRPLDKVMVISFDEEVHMLSEATSDRNQIYRAIKSTRIATGTSLYEAMNLVMNERLRQIEGRKAVILFTDGVDTTSRRSNDMRNLSDAMELDSLIYPIRYDTFADVQRMKGRSTNTAPPPIRIPFPPQSDKFPIPSVGVPSSQGTTVEEYQKAAEYLDQLAQRTGGRVYEASTLVNLSDAYTRIASELREFYSIAYYPKDDRVSGKTANVKVKVDQTGLVVRSRETFIRRNPKK